MFSVLPSLPFQSCIHFRGFLSKILKRMTIAMELETIKLYTHKNGNSVILQVGQVTFNQHSSEVMIEAVSVLGEVRSY